MGRSVCKGKKKIKRQIDIFTGCKGKSQWNKRKRWGMTAGNGQWRILQQSTIMGLTFISQINIFEEAKREMHILTD